MKTKKSTGPLVSVVIPCYNHAAYVLESIQSVIDQDYENIELIIIDDGSKDDSIEKIQQLSELCKQRFVRFEFRHRENKGLSATLNEAIAWCEGEYYSAIASDDMMIREKTSIQVKYLNNNPGCAGVFGGMIVLNEMGETVRSVSVAPAQYDFGKIFLMQHNLPAPTQMVRLQEIRKSGGYRNDLAIEDWYMWLAITSRGGRLDNAGVVLAKYRRHAGNLSKQLLIMELARKKIIELYASHDLYEKANANALIMSAIDIQLIDKTNSLYKFFAGLRMSPSQVFQARVARYMVKLLMPRVIFNNFFITR
jgi:alpha-1,3-rhamnosyltransferase